MISTNILGTAMMTRAALQDMQARNSWGHIINMGEHSVAVSSCALTLLPSEHDLRGSLFEHG